MYDPEPSLFINTLLDDGLRVRVLDLETLIEVKRRANRAKDNAVLLGLEATLDEIRQA